MTAPSIGAVADGASFPDASERAAPSRSCAPWRGWRMGCEGWTTRQLRLALGATLLFWVVAALMWPLTDSVVPWDSKNHFYPMLRYLSAALASGELPLWNPYHFSGHPAVADPQALLFTPTMLLFGWLDSTPSMQTFDLVVFAHLLPGALAMLPLFARRGWRPEGAVVAAFVFILGGSASARLQHTGIIFGYGLYPLALLMLEMALDRRRYLYAVLFGIVAAAMVVGRDQVAFLSGLSLLGFALYEATRADRPFAWLRERLGIFATMGGVGAVLLAVPIILTVQLIGTSTRPAFSFGVAAMGSLPPESFVTVLFANIFGSLRWTYDYWGPDWHSLAEGTWTDRATNYLFAGTLPALLILWHGIGGGRLFAREFRYFGIVGILAALYALGRYTPLFGLLFERLPGIALYRRPADATFVINIALAFAAGYLVHRYIVDGAPKLAMARRSVARLACLGLAVLLLGSAVYAALAFGIEADRFWPTLASIAGGSAIAAAIAWVFVTFGHSTSLRVGVATLAVGVTAVELIARNAACALNAEPASRYAVFSELPPEQMHGLHVLKAELAERHRRGERPRVEILGLGGAWQNASMVLQLEDTIGYNPLRLADYERAVGPGENAVDPSLRTFPGTFRGYRCRLAGLLGLEYLVLDRPAEKLPKHFPRLGQAKLLYGSGQMWIYRLNPTAPRAYLATHLISVDSESVLTQEELPEFDRHSAALIEQDEVASLKGDYGLKDDTVEPAPANGSVAIRDYRRNSVSLEVDTDRNSVVVLHDIYYPGWEVTVDGKPAHMLRTNLLFRGVEVPPGHHLVEFTFRPLSLHNLVAAATQILEGDGEEKETVTR